MKFSIVAAIVLVLVGGFFYIKWNAPKIIDTVPNTIVIGTSADFQPFCFKEHDEIVGFDIDIAKEVAHRLNKPTEFKDMPFELLIPQLQLGSVHIVAACMTPTPERAQRITFSEPYFTEDHLVAITLHSQPPITALSDLNGKKVIVNQGYTADRYMSKITGPELVRLPTVSDAMLALKSGRADAFVTGSKAIEPYFQQQGRDQFNVFDIQDTTESIALALSPLYPKLAGEIGKVLESMKTDGTIQRIKEKWHLV